MHNNLQLLDSLRCITLSYTLPHVPHPQQRKSKAPISFSETLHVQSYEICEIYIKWCLDFFREKILNPMTRSNSNNEVVALQGLVLLFDASRSGAMRRTVSKWSEAFIKNVVRRWLDHSVKNASEALSSKVVETLSEALPKVVKCHPRLHRHRERESKVKRKNNYNNTMLLVLI